MKHFAPALIFSASPTPASVAAALAALDILETEPERITKLNHNASKMRAGFRSMGFKIIDGHDSAIVPVIIGETDKTLVFWRELYRCRRFRQCIRTAGRAAGNGNVENELHGDA